MELDLLVKSIIGIFSTVGTIATAYFSLGQTRKIQAELLEKFESAIEKKQKHSVTELFRLIHGLRMNYVDIEKLIADDNCSKIIYSLQKTPGIVHFEKGQFQYTNFGKNRLFKLFDRYTNILGLYFFGFLWIVSFYLLVIEKGSTSIAGLFLIIFSSFVCAYIVRQNRYDKMISGLIEPEGQTLHNTQEDDARD